MIQFGSIALCLILSLNVLVWTEDLEAGPPETKVSENEDAPERETTLEANLAGDQAVISGHDTSPRIGQRDVFRRQSGRSGKTEYETRECYFNLNSRISERELCIRNTEALHEELACEQDEEVVLPTGRRLLDAGGGASGPWEQVGEMRCVAPEEESNVDLQMAVETEFAQLPIAPAPITIQPGEGWTFVNVPTIVYSSPDSQVLTTELLGTQVEIEVTPASFSWDFDDDTAQLETVDPGQPYPNHTVDHTYVRTGVSEISLTTTWTGRFRPNASGPWLPITGTATTTTTAPALEVREATARLVEDPLN